MLVKNWMGHPPISVNADAALQDAIELLTKHGIHILPVVDNDHLTGVITKTIAHYCMWSIMMKIREKSTRAGDNKISYDAGLRCPYFKNSHQFKPPFPVSNWAM